LSKLHLHVNCRRSYIYVANTDQATKRIPLNTDIVVKGLGEFILSVFTTINQNSMKTILQYSLIVCSYREHPYMSKVLPAGQNSPWDLTFITFHALLLFATILALQPKILLILEGTEETNFVFARESPCFNEYHHLIVCILKRRQKIGKIQHDHYETFLFCLVILLLTNANAIHLNSGPRTEREYLCGTCDKTVNWEERGVICETCEPVVPCRLSKHSHSILWSTRRLRAEH
jgi:hypothetical protein